MRNIASASKKATRTRQLTTMERYSFASLMSLLFTWKPENEKKCG